MSVMIKSMNMPKNCMECELRFIARGLDTECIFSNDTVDDCTDRRLYRCPLVEIPTPHGRLIDADALRKSIESTYGWGAPLWTLDCFECIYQAPTIIEAEVSE